MRKVAERRVRDLLMQHERLCPHSSTLRLHAINRRGCIAKDAEKMADNFFHIPELTETLLLNDKVTPTELLRLYGLSYQANRTIRNSKRLQRKLFLLQSPLPPDVPASNFKSSAAKQNTILTRDIMRPFLIRSNPDYIYLMYWTLRNDPLPSQHPPDFLSLTLWMFPAENGEAQENMPRLPKRCLEMYLTDIPIGAVVNMAQRTVDGSPDRRTDVWFPGGTKLGDVLQWQEMWSKGEVGEDDRIVGVKGLEGVFCNRNLLGLGDRGEWTGCL